MQRVKEFPLQGGLDLVSPASEIRPGQLTGVQNYEPSDEGGYRRIAGFERFSGLPSPSEADYWYVFFDAGTTAFVAEEIVNGGTSLETAEVLSVVVESGDWSTNDAAGYLVVFNASGAFSDDETLTGDVAGAATANGASQRNAATTDADHKTHTLAAQAGRRADISALPGSGVIRGIWSYNGVKYAFRDNAGATACIMYKSSATGFQTVDLGEKIDFTAGTSAFLEGETITQGGVTATVVAVGVTSGSWSGNDAAGSIYIKSRAGGSFSAGAITSPSGAATCSGAESAVSLPAGGNYEFQNYNFGGQLSTRYMWGCNGVSRAFRFDGTDFAFIHITGLSDSVDKPTHIRPHKKHLCLSISSSLMISSLGLPMEYDAITGAAELTTGDLIVGMDIQPGDVLAIYNRNSTYLLYGNDAQDWDLNEYSLERGAVEWSLQNVMVPLYLDDRGIMYLNPTQVFGDFKAKSISEVIDPIIQTVKDKVLSSVRIKDKNQYRLFFTDNTALLARVSASLKVEYTVINYGKPVHAICAEENTDGVEEVFFGSDDGYIYQAEKGESFDGELIEYFLRLAFYDCGTSRQKKRFHKVTMLLDAVQPPDLNYIPEFSYGNPNIPAPQTVTVPEEDINTGGGYWGSAIWGEFLWDGQPVGEAEAYVDGQGFNLSITVRGESNYEAQHTLQSATYHYTPRGLKR